MRLHVAGHLLLSQRPVSGCGFCGVDLVEGGCFSEVKGGGISSNCSYQLSGMKLEPKNSEREEALKRRMAESEENWAAASREVLKGKGALVRNFPIKCPVEACKEKPFKYNLIHHLLDDTRGNHLVPGGGRCQAWRIQGKDLLLKLHNLMCSPASRVRGRSQDLTPEAVVEAARLLGGVRKILQQGERAAVGLLPGGDRVGE
jgi:hypothetical protein